MSITLVQFRPAWFEQLLMRFANVPHVVVNSPYAATESTGPLPYLQEIRPSEPAILVGRHDPSVPVKEKNCILDYLQTQEHVDLDKGLSASQKALSHVYTALVKTQLDPALLSLRFADRDAWDHVYRQQYVEASCGGNHGFLPPFGSRFQAWSIRAVALKQLTPTWSVKESCSIARTGYSSLETQLGENLYLLGTAEPTTVDALLWAHLADALCDVHLVLILADFPNLIQYFQRVFDKYFRLDTDTDWKVWNYEQNLRSPFQKLPLEDTSVDKTSTFHDALELMQSFSVHTHDLQEVLTVTKEKRLQETREIPSRQSALYRWRMGGDIRSPKQEASDAEETPQQQKWRKDHKYNDELWLSSVAALVGLAVFLGTSRGE